MRSSITLPRIVTVRVIGTAGPSCNTPVYRHPNSRIGWFPALNHFAVVFSVVTDSRHKKIKQQPRNMLANKRGRYRHQLAYGALSVGPWWLPTHPQTT